MNKELRQLIPAILIFIALTLLVGCGNGVTISNKAFDSSSNVARLAVDGVDEFKFCVARVRLETAEEAKNNDNANDGDEANYTQFAPGLIDVTDGTAKDWGEVSLPAKAQVKRIKVKVKKDESACGVNYSLLFNGLSTPRDIEFRWTFDPPVDVDGATKALRLSFDEIVASLRASALSDEIQLKERIEAAEPEAAKE